MSEPNTPKHGDERDRKDVTLYDEPKEFRTTSGTEFSVPTVKYSGTQSERWCESCQTWVLCRGFMSWLVCPVCNRPWPGFE